MSSLNKRLRIAGAIMQTTKIPVMVKALRVPDSVMAEMAPMGPTRPQVPMPAETPVHSSWKSIVAMGPVMQDASVGGIQISGCLTIFGIWSMDVPMPWEIRPPVLFSRYEETAKPTICAQHPARAAPPAIPLMPMDAQIAALEIGSVRIMPTTAETTIPMRNGCSMVASLMTLPRKFMATAIAGHVRMDMR